MSDLLSHKQTQTPPSWANRFLEWYCRPELLDEIQGDAFELYFREVKKSKRTADLKFIWNVIRFFRWKNIYKKKQQNLNYSTGMLQNIFKVAVRNFFRQPAHSLLNVFGLSVSFIAAFFIGLWVFHETSYDRFHTDPENIFQMMSHIDANGTIETYTAARANTDLSVIPEVAEKAVVITGSRWPNELCFRPEGKVNECIYHFGIYSEKPFFSIFNFPILKGDKNPLANPQGISISEKMAATLYGDADPLGKSIKIDDHYPVVVVAVFKDVPTNSSLQFDFVLSTDVFARMRGLSADYFSKDFLPVYFKTNTPVSKEYLNAKLNEPSILTEDLKKDKLTYSAFPFTDLRLKGEFVNGKSIGGRIQYVQIFILVAVLVVVMAVINFVNMSTARATNRSKEIGIRKVTGAQRSSIVIQFMGEAFLVTLLALVVAAICTQLSLPAFNRLIGESLALNFLNPFILICVVSFLVIVSIAGGLYPAFVISGFQPAKVLKGTTVTHKSGAQQLRKVLLVVQVSISIGIVIFTGVLFQQLKYIQQKNLGMDSKNMLHIEPTYKLLKQYQAFKNELLSNNGIENITATNADPINLSSETTGVKWPGMPDGKNASFKLLGGSHEMAETFGLKLLEGRMFEEKPKDSLVSEVIVTERAVKEMELKEPVGTEIGIGDGKFTIIGVVKDFHTESLKQEQLPVILYSHDVLNCSRLYVKYREGTTAASLEAIEKAYKKIEPAFTMKYSFVDDAFNKMYKTEHTASTMLVFFTGIALIIAIIGVVGLATYNVLKRKKEIGIKRVFGASAVQVLSMLSREFILLIIVAAAFSSPLAWFGANQWLSGFAYRIDMPWWIFGATLFSITSLTILIISMQGLKTANSNPTDMLRSE